MRSPAVSILVFLFYLAWAVYSVYFFVKFAAHIGAWPFG